MNTFDNLYHLKKDFGKPIDLYQITSTLNLETGLKTVATTKTHIKKAIIYPQGQALQSNKSAEEAFLRTNKPRGFGGNINTTKTTIAIEKKDLPKNYTFKLNDYFIFEYKRYTIADRLDYDDAIVINGVYTEGQETAAIIDINVKDRLPLGQVILGEEIL